jgi:hypothetical protein
MLQDTMYSNNLHTEDNLKATVQEVVSSASPAEL